MHALIVRQRIKDHGPFPRPTSDRLSYGCGGFVESRIRNEDTERQQIIPPEGFYMADRSMGWVGIVCVIPATATLGFEHQRLFRIDRKLSDVDWNFIDPHRLYFKRRKCQTASRMTSYGIHLDLTSIDTNPTSRTSRAAPTGHKLFNCISRSLQSRRWAHI